MASTSTVPVHPPGISEGGQIANCTTGNTASHNSAFRHKPLDHSKASIRLLQILPSLSTDGPIQCHMWHADLDSEYTCLSYVWGTEQDQRCVLVNGEVLYVRKNLYDFLSVAQKSKTVAQRTFWIDAISINQESILEKNHQVAQMGLIYTKAQEVVAWLGFSRGISRALAFCTGSTSQNHETVGEAREFWDRQWYKNLIYDWHEFQRHPYWTRAWITQEVLCARRIVVLGNESEFDLSQCPFLRLLLPGINQKGGEWDRKGLRHVSPGDVREDDFQTEKTHRPLS
jgi:hypothetical protein